MEMYGSYCAMGYVFEVYFPDNQFPDVWTIWAVRDRKVLWTSTARIPVTSEYGIDADVVNRIDAAVESAMLDVMGVRIGKGIRRLMDEVDAVIEAGVLLAKDDPTSNSRPAA